MALHSDFGRAGIEIIGFTRHQSGKKVDSDHKSVKHGLPLCEPNYNLVELGPRGTGKSYAYQEISPYVILLTGPTTVANLFYNMVTGRIGLVGLWDAVAFDEVADLQKMPKLKVLTEKRNLRCFGSRRRTQYPATTAVRLMQAISAIPPLLS